MNRNYTQPIYSTFFKDASFLLRQIWDSPLLWDYLIIKSKISKFSD